MAKTDNKRKGGDLGVEADESMKDVVLKVRVFSAMAGYLLRRL